MNNFFKYEKITMTKLEMNGLTMSKINMVKLTKEYIIYG